jgi:hypothetical protein
MAINDEFARRNHSRSPHAGDINMFNIVRQMAASRVRSFGRRVRFKPGDGE